MISEGEVEVGQARDQPVPGQILHSLVEPLLKAGNEGGGLLGDDGDMPAMLEQLQLAPEPERKVRDDAALPRQFVLVAPGDGCVLDIAAPLGSPDASDEVVHHTVGVQGIHHQHTVSAFAQGSCYVRLRSTEMRPCLRV